MNLKPNKEVTLMLEVLKSYFHKTRLDSKFTAEINWAKLSKSQELHALQPMLHYVFTQSQIEVPTDFKKELKEFGLGQAAMNLSFKSAYKRIEKTFSEAKLPIVPFKGFIFSEFLFPENLRAGSDLDLMISPDKLEESLQLFLDLGYKFVHVFGNELTLEKILTKEARAFMYEVSMSKNQINLDIHWAFHYPFLPYHYPKDFLLNRNSLSERIFWTLLNHHGGKESWLRLKNLADLAAFVQKADDNFDWQKVVAQTKEFGVYRIFINGLFLINSYFEIQIPKSLQAQIDAPLTHSCLKETLQFWNKGKHWKNSIVRVRFEQILMKSQSKTFSKWKYFNDCVRAYMTPNPIEEHRFYTFPKKYKTLNFISKIITYFVKRTF